MATIGHNTVAADQLKSIVSRIEKLAEEKQAIADDIKDVYAESKGNGFCPTTIRKIISLRKLDAQEREERTSTYYVDASRPSGAREF